MLGIKGYKEAQATTFNGELPKLQPGGYVLKIMAVKVEENDYGTKLAFQFDIAEGENKGFYKKLYDATPDEWEGKKWKGSYRLTIPQNKGDDAKYRKAVGFFKSQIEAFISSNKNLHIDPESDWDEQTLKGKIVGAVFNEKEWNYNGKTGMFTQCKRLLSADDIRNGKFTVPKPDMLSTAPQTATETSTAPIDLSDYVETETTDEVPF